jgi:elongation factor G
VVRLLAPKPRERHGHHRFVPLANMFGYVNNLRSMSQGRAQYSMVFDHYEQCLRPFAEEVQAKYA